MSSLIVLKQMVMIFALILTGYFLYKKKLISGAASKDLSAIVVDVCCPALIISSMFQDMSGISRKNVAIVAAAGIVYYAFLILLGFGFAKFLKVPKKDKEAYVLMTVFGNLGFIGLPVASAILGHESILYVVIFNFLYNIVIFTFGIMLVKKGVEGVERSWKDIFTPGFVSCFIAFAIYWFDLTVPASVQSVVHYCANACTFLSMLVIGMSVVGMKPAAVFGNRRLLLFTGIRFVLVPVVAALLLQSVLTDYIMRATVVLMLALPAGNMPVMLAEQYGKDAHAISESIILSTLLSVVTITFVFMFV